MVVGPSRFCSWSGSLHDLLPAVFRQHLAQSHIASTLFLAVVAIDLQASVMLLDLLVKLSFKRVHWVGVTSEISTLKMGIL